jgi:uncharacterized membrane protein
MTTPLLMLVLLTLPLAIAWRLRRLGLDVSMATGGAIGLVLVFLLTASAHFLAPGPLAEMLPPLVPAPARLAIIYLTGVLEIALAIGIALPATRRLAGIAAIATLVLFFPANVYAALAQVEMGGHAWGPVYLLIRAPLQALLIAWTWWFAVRPAASAGAKTSYSRSRSAALSGSSAGGMA